MGRESLPGRISGEIYKLGLPAWEKLVIIRLVSAGMAELADALDLGSSVHRRAGSSPVTRIILILNRKIKLLCFMQVVLFSYFHVEHLMKANPRYMLEYKNSSDDLFDERLKI